MTWAAALPSIAKKGPARHGFPGGPQSPWIPSFPLEFFAFASFHKRGGINSSTVQLHVCDLSIFINQVIDAAANLAFVVIQAVLFGHIASPVAQQREGDSNLFGPLGIAERTVHAYTQYLGICGLQFFKVLLEGLHLRCSTTGEGKDIKRQCDVFLASKIA